MKQRNPGPVALVAGGCVPVFIVPRRTRNGEARFDVFSGESHMRIVDMREREEVIGEMIRSRGFRMLERTKRGSLVSDYPMGGYHPSGLESGSPYFVRDGFKAVRCHGEAHSNPYIDNCGLCAPLWGVRVVPEDAPEEGGPSD